MCFGGGPSVPETKQVAAAPTVVSSSDVATDSARKAASTARRKAGYDSTIVSGAAPALVQAATDSTKKTLG
ncbi:MAG: hypothetical protein VB133_07545 [Anaeromusa sp.]|uniref:hypothetical protein n=1 Tax=Anaeromusa sp. TaxID=1872520 RepID=UPI002B2108BE|nr:hypothetical protein [Anaeromusa sp.]MEA4834970.1 hypothetical protein [Anaeromusa sp.]